MDYEKAYKEALEDIRVIYPNLKGDAKLAVEHAFPELSESEDERIRKWLIDYFSSIKKTVWIHRDITCEQILDWLEKQKENPKNADSISADCASLAKCEDRNSKYGVFPEDVIVVARACEKLEVHGYTELAHALKNVNLYTKKPVDYDHEMWKNCEANFEGEKKEVIDHPEKYGLQKEQKPAEYTLQSSWSTTNKAEEKSETPSNLDELMDNYFENLQVPEHQIIFEDTYRKIATDFYEMGRNSKTAEWSEEDKTHLNWIIECLGSWKYQVPEFADQYQSAIDFLKSLRPQPKQEWSEDDEKMLEQVVDVVYDYCPDPVAKYKLKDWLNLRFKSIRPCPSWKPSEEQMEALERFIRSWGESGTMSPQNPILCAATSLLTDLNKLL